MRCIGGALRAAAGACALVAGPVTADTMLGGGQGLLLVPTAEVRAEGGATISHTRHYPDLERRTDIEADVYHVGVGLLPGLELGGRAIANATRVGQRDLSADVKYRLPWPDGPAALAVGAVDLGGTDVLMRRWYGVGSWSWSTLELTLGVGEARTVLDGAFGGLQWRPWPWLGLLAEHDADDVNAGMRVVAPPWAGWRVGLIGAWRGALEEVEYGAHLEFPLGRRYRLEDPGDGDVAPAHAGAHDLGTLATAPPEAPESASFARPDSAALRAKLLALGFESVQLGRRAPATLVVRLENRRYNHSAADGIGLALGTIGALAPPGTERIELYLFAYGVSQLMVVAPADPALAGPIEVRNVDGLADAAGIAWDAAARPGLSAVELALEPVLRTFVATESGLLDYALGARARVTAPLARGLLVNVGVQASGADSDDFEEGRPFAPTAPENGIDLAVAQYVHHARPDWLWLWSAGRTQVFRADLDVAALEQAWVRGGGRHLWRTKLMALRGEPGAREVLLAGYTWFDPARDYAVSLTGGRFYAGDAGVRVELNRWFGDTQVGVFWRGASVDDQAVGAALSLPLTPRRDTAPRLLQVKGVRRWGHSLGSTLNSAEAANPVRPLLLYEPQLDLDLRRDFLDSGRLGAGYLEGQLPRMRDAHERYRQDVRAGDG